MIPVTTFVHLDDVSEPNSDEPVKMWSCTDEPNANSTMIEPRLCSQTEPCLRISSVLSRLRNSGRSCTPTHNCPPVSECVSGNCSSHGVGHISHIPRAPPCPATYTLPSCLSKSVETSCIRQDEDLFGMIKLKDNDVCYTSGTIEWVGRKRSYPINSGFKVICDPDMKKIKKFDNTFTCDSTRIKECDCGDVLPTVNAIVDHLNALHEAVDLVDLRLNNLEDVMCKDERC